METYWNYEITVDGRCVLSGGHTDLSRALSEAVSSAVYYQAVYPAAKVRITGITEHCARCHNSGTALFIRKTRPAKLVRCPACKGKLATGRLDDIPFKMPDEANGITLVQIPHKKGAV